MALIFAGAALYAGSRCWLATRKLVVLDVPISLSRGHITTREFSINLDSGYLMEIEVKRAPSPENLNCRMWGCPGTPDILRVRWTLSSAGQVEASGNSDGLDGRCFRNGMVGRYVGRFRSSGGRHRLDIDVLSDTAALNQGNPSLTVAADDEGYGRLSGLSFALTADSCMLIVVGGALLWLPRLRRNPRQSAGLAIYAGPRSGRPRMQTLRRFPPGPLISKPQSFGILAVSAVGLVGFSLWMNPDPWRYRRDSLRTPQAEAAAQQATTNGSSRWFSGSTRRTAGFWTASRLLPKSYPAY